MIWKIMIVIINSVGALYAFPYGKWEYLQNNKSGGILVYTVAIINVGLAIAQIFV